MDLTKPKKILLLTNGASGTNSVVSNLFEIITLLSARNCVVTVYPIIPSEGLTSEKILSKIDHQYDIIACCGGDGTLNHVVNQMVKNRIDLPLGYIPTGSTNDFSRSLNKGRSLSLQEQCEAITNGTEFPYDVGKINDEYFNYIAAFGAFTKISYETSQKLKNALGYAAYALNAIIGIPEGLSYHSHVRYIHDGQYEEGDYIFGAISNTSSIAGVQSPLISNAKLDDGHFEVILIRQPNNLIDINRILSKIASGDTDDNYVTVFETSHIEFIFDSNTAWTIDGEEGEKTKRAIIDCQNKAIKILISNSKQNDKIK